MWARAVATWIVLAPSLAFGQVNVETLRRDPDAPGWSGVVEGTLGLARGNLERVDVGGKAQVQLQTLHPQLDATRPPFPRARVLLMGSGAYGEVEDVVAASQLFAHTRSTVMWIPRVGSEVYAQVQRDDFLRLQSRIVVGTAARFAVVHEHVAQLDLGTGPMVEHERYLEAEEVGGRTSQDAVRWSSYAVLRVASDGDVVLGQSTLYVQPRVDDPADTRLLCDAQVDVRVVGNLSLGLKVSLLHDSAPPVDVEPTDLRLANVVKLEL